MQTQRYTTLNIEAFRGGLSHARIAGKPYLTTKTGTFYHADTPAACIAALEYARIMGAKVRLVMGDHAAGKCWLEEHDVIGTIGRSMGPARVPLLIKTSRSTGGHAILDHCLLAVIDVETGTYLYRSDALRAPSLRIERNSPHWLSVIHDEHEEAARFYTVDAAHAYIGFMRLDHHKPRRFAERTSKRGKVS